MLLGVSYRTQFHTLSPLSLLYYQGEAERVLFLILPSTLRDMSQVLKIMKFFSQKFTHQTLENKSIYTLIRFLHAWDAAGSCPFSPATACCIVTSQRAALSASHSFNPSEHRAINRPRPTV
jgi:hypothetical protein